jgi:hypothetical protein
VGAEGLVENHEKPRDIQNSEVRAAIGDAPPADPDLLAVVDAWPRLNDDQRRAIIEIIDRV